MTVHIYTWNDKAYIPVVAQAEAGFYVDVEPVYVVNLSDRRTLIEAIERVAAADTPMMKTPDRDTLSSPVVLKYTGLKTWRDFERKMKSWEVQRNSLGWRLVPYKTGQTKRGTIPDDARATTFGPDISIRELAEQIADLITK